MYKPWKASRPDVYGYLKDHHGTINHWHPLGWSSKYGDPPNFETQPDPGFRAVGHGPVFFFLKPLSRGQKMPAIFGEIKLDAKVYGKFEGFPFNGALFWVGNVAPTFEEDLTRKCSIESFDTPIALRRRTAGKNVRKKRFWIPWGAVIQLTFFFCQKLKETTTIPETLKQYWTL